MNIIGYYKHLNLVEKDGLYLVVNRQDKKVLFNGSEESANKYFIMLVAGFIDETFNKIES